MQQAKKITSFWAAIVYIRDPSSRLLGLWSHSNYDMICGMIAMDGAAASPANRLCKSCGLCCSGHLFAWTKLRSAELDAIEALGLRVFRSPGQRGFNQPCPLWQGQCTIYASPAYPRFCHTYKCKLLKKLLEESISLEHALQVIGKAKAMIDQVEKRLPDSPNPNFRERLVAELEGMPQRDPEFRQRLEALLELYAEVFGVDDLVQQTLEG